MQTRKSKQSLIKKPAFFNTNSNSPEINCASSEIRIGISIADEKAKSELRKRKLKSPLTTEEQLFLDK